MNIDFSSPQRQSKIGLVVLFANAVFAFLKAIWIAVLIVFLRGKSTDVYIGIGVFALILVAFGIYSYLKYRTFSFYIDQNHNEFVVKHGILNKTKTVIQLHKIQQVNLNQNLVHRIVNVFQVSIDSAGSEGKEVKIDAVSKEMAIILKSKLIDNEYFNVDNTVNDNVVLLENEVEKESFIKIDLISLLKIGITSNYVKSIGLLLTFFVTIYENFNHAGVEELIDGNRIEGFIESNITGVYAILMAILLLITVVFVINVVRTLVKYFGFKIAKQKGSLVMSYGLFAKQNTILRPEKVQIIKITRNYFQKKLKILEIRINQAISDETKKDKSTIEIPGCNEFERDEILKLIFNQIPKKGEKLRPNFRKLLFLIFILIILPLSAYFTVGKWVSNSVFEYKFIMIGYVVFALIGLIFGFKNNSLHINNDHIIKQSGVWDIDNEIIKIEKIQAISMSQLFWHKSLNIGSLTIYTAGGNINFQLGNFDKINQYVNLWLHKIEKEDTNWM
jgi:putative membrane protein